MPSGFLLAALASADFYRVGTLRGAGRRKTAPKGGSSCSNLTRGFYFAPTGFSNGFFASGLFCVFFNASFSALSVTICALALSSWSANAALMFASLVMSCWTVVCWAKAGAAMTPSEYRHYLSLENRQNNPAVSAVRAAMEAQQQQRKGIEQG